MCLIPYANNKGAAQLAHPRRLISDFVVRCQDRIIPLVYISEISRFYMVFVAEQVSWCLVWSETPEDTFSHGVAQMIKKKTFEPAHVKKESSLFTYVHRKWN